MPEGPTLRHAAARDAAAIAGLHADSWRRHYRGAYSDAYLDGDLDSERLAVWSARLERPSANAVTLVAEVEHVVGFVHAVIDQDRRWGSLIENLHVRHDRHRQGIGRRLLSAAAKEVGETALHAPVHLWVLKQNSRAQAFYRALGGNCVEAAPCPPPGGVADRLHGAPRRLRFVWPAGAAIVCPP